jgi:hypothetical protein
MSVDARIISFVRIFSNKLFGSLSEKTPTKAEIVDKTLKELNKPEIIYLTPLGF